MLQGTDRVHGDTSPGGGTSRHSTHRAPPFTMRTDEAAALPSPAVVLSAGSIGNTAASDALPAAAHFPACTGYRASRFRWRQRAGHRAGEGLSSSRRHYPNVPRPLRRGVLHGCIFRIFTASMAFALTLGARLSLSPTSRQGSSRRGRLRVMLRTARLLPLTGLSTLGFEAGRFPPTPPACYR